MTAQPRSTVMPAWFHPAWEDLTDMVVVIDGATVLRYINPYTSRLLGVSSEEALGRSIADFLHPDDLVRAGEVLTLMSGGDMTVEVTPATYRIRRSDGTWCPLEINSSGPALAGCDADIVVLVGRYSGDRDLQDTILRDLVGGAPIDQVIERVPDFGLWRHPTDEYAVLHIDESGNRRAVGSPLAVELLSIDGGADAPWERAARSGVEVVAQPDELEATGHGDELGRRLAEEDLGACWAIPVPDPLFGDPAVIVAWSRSHRTAPAVHRYALENMARALGLVLRWRHQVAELQTAARRDVLTGVVNRLGFFELLDRLDVDADHLGGAPAPPPSLVGVLYVDLDGFKAVNDDHGHRAGDAVLAEAARRMAEVLRPGDTVARLGGDEFAIVCPLVGGVPDAEAVAARLVATLAEPFAMAATEVRIGASVGIAVGDPSAVTPEALLDRADRALYQAKSEGRGRWRVAPDE